MEFSWDEGSECEGQCLPDSSGDGNKQLAAASLLLLSCARRCWRPEHLFFFFSSLKPDIFEFEPIISHLQRSVQRWNTAFRDENFLLLPESTRREERAGNKVRYRGDVITLPLSTEITPLPQERAARPQTHATRRARGLVLDLTRLLHFSAAVPL